jgi:putative membrane protein
MFLFSNILILLVSLLHFYFLVLEMFLWTKPIGLKVFRQSQQKAQDSQILAMNQGLYNGFLAVGLLVGVYVSNVQIGFAFKIFFLICIIIAGIFGAISVSKRIFYIQSLPAIIALVTIFIIYYNNR